jgi:adenylate cyclase
LGTQSLKGIPEAIEAYTLLGLKPAVASRPFRGAALSSFRGRNREFAALQRALRRTDDGDAQVVGISGAPGTGKSRLCYEFAEWCRGRLIPILEARAQIYGHATPLQPVLEFFRHWFEILPTDDAATARHRIAERLLAISRTFEADLPLLYEFLGIADESMVPLRLQPKARHARLIEVVRHIVRYSGSTPSVIIVDDLHWLDEASEEFITTLMDAVANTRTMLVVNYRPSYVAPWMDWPYFNEISLGELNSEHTRALVEELVGAGHELEDVRHRIAQRSAGNPFFAEELARSLTENPVQRAIGESLPATVEAVIGARIDRLGEGEKAVLQVGSIIGKEFPLAVLDEVVGPLSSPLDMVLRRLSDHGLIQEQGGAGGREFSFRHPLIQEVSYATQLKSRRRALHAMVAKAMERYYHDRLDEFAALVAYHYEAAGELEVAARYESRAAQWVGSTHSAQAIKHWQKVRLLLRGDRSSANDSLQIMASGQIAWLGWREGMAADSAKSLVEEALDLARKTDDSMVPLLLFVDGRITVSTGGPADTYVARVREALSLLRGSGNTGRIATLNCALSQAYGWAGLLNEALDANTASLEGATEVETFDHQFLGYSVEHWLMTLRGRILLRLGRFDEAASCLSALIDIEDSLGDPTVQFLPHYGYVDLAWCLGDARLAQKHAARVAQIAEKHGSPYLHVFALAATGIAECVDQDFDAALRHFGECLSFARTAKAAMEYEPELLASIADCHLHLEQHDAAVAAAREAIGLARTRSSRLPECRASITLGAALAALGGRTAALEAETWFTSAQELIGVTGAKIYQPLLARERARLPALDGRGLS